MGTLLEKSISPHYDLFVLFVKTICYTVARWPEFVWEKYFLTSLSMLLPTLLLAIFILYRTCRFSQNSGSIPKYLPRRNAVSAVISLLPCTIWLIRFAGTLMSFANLFWVISNGLRNSSNNMSPGVIGVNFFAMILPLVIINNFYVEGVFFWPYEAYTPLIVNSDTMLSVSFSF